MITFKGRVEGNKFIIEDINEVDSNPRRAEKIGQYHIKS